MASRCPWAILAGTRSQPGRGGEGGGGLTLRGILQRGLQRLPMAQYLVLGPQGDVLGGHDVSGQAVSCLQLAGHALRGDPQSEIKTAR
ncbi:hypothetical protein chiPu_0033485, partial [Chiloscyllium punctatum]|nr:hypothetical protein [Chiloscyllium punctatum]